MLTVTPRGFKAKLFLPCANNRCHERMQLRFVRVDGTALDRPYYQCQNRHCYYGDLEHVLYPEDMRTEHVIEDGRTFHRYKSDEGISHGEGMTAL